MDVQIDRLGQIQAEDTHNRFCVDDISAGNQIKINIELSSIVYERFNLINGI